MSVVYTMETIILPRGLLMVHSGSLTFQKTNNIPHTGNYFLEFMLLLIVLLSGVLIYISVNFRRNLKPQNKPAKIKKFSEFQSNAKVKKEISAANGKIAKAKNTTNVTKNPEKSPIRPSNKKRTSGNPSQNATPAGSKKKSSRLTFPHHPLLKNDCPRDTSDDKSIIPIRKSVDTRGSRKSANEPEPKPKKNPPVSKDPIDVESVPAKEMTKKRHSHHPAQKKEAPSLEIPAAPPGIKQVHFLMPEYTKLEMGQIKAYDAFVIPFPNLAECGYPFIMGDDKAYGVYVQQGSYPKRLSIEESDQSASSSSSEDNSSESNSSSNSTENLTMNNTTVRCCRCKGKFDITKNTRCNYHVGKLCRFSGYQRYLCCSADRKSAGCAEATQHVWTGIQPGINGPMEGYVGTEPSYTFKHRVIALDCEMCFTKAGLELTRVSVLDFRGCVIYDTLVLPENPIIDYNTEFSGLSEKSFQEAESVASLQEVQETILELIDCFTIVIGHGLENDFRALKLVHYTVIDTALIFREVTYNGEWKRHSLRNLVYWHLNRKIQNDQNGHNSIEDAASCLDLINYVISSPFYYAK